MDTKLITEKLCSPYHIAVRGQEAKYKREVIQHKREQNELERTFKHNDRKLKVTQRGVMSLLGRDPYYPDCHPDNILFSHNQPGFCYRRNGTPRRFTSLAESKTRKILNDLEGNLEYLEEPATNIVSDNPLLTEVLSSPEIVSILCNLRSTAAIMKNSQLFKQFVRNIQKSSPRPLRFKEETPYDFLRQYRTDLINQFFESLQIQAEIRLATALPNEAGNDLLALPENITGISSIGDKTDFNTDYVDVEQFTTALKAGLTEVQGEHFHPKYLSSDGTTPVNTDSPCDPVIKQQLLQLGLRKIESFKGLSPSVYGFHEPKKLQVPQTTTSNVTSFPIPPPNTSETSPNQGLTRNLFMTTTDKNKDDCSTRQIRNEFDSFVKSLITEVENISEAGKTMRSIRGQNASKNHGDTTSPFIKLLKKKSLFSSLTEDDLLFYEYEGGKKGAEWNLAKGLHINPNSYNNNNTSNSGQTFSAPATQGDSIVTSTTAEYIRQNGPYHRPTSKPRENTAHSYDTTYCDTNCPSESSSLGYKSIARVSCGACKAKVWQTCNTMRTRDIKDKKVNPHWRPPGYDEWSNTFSSNKKTKGIKGVPTPSRKNYLYASENTSANNSRPDSSLMSRDYKKPFHLHSNYFLGTAPTPTPVVFTTNKIFPTVSHASLKRDGESNKYYNFNKMSDSFNIGAPEEQHEKPSRGGPSWTLKISRLDILKLRHELDVEQIRGDLEKFQKKVSKFGSTTNLK